MAKEHEVWSRGNGDEPMFVAEFHDKGEARAFIRRLRKNQRETGRHVYAYDVRTRERSHRKRHRKMRRR